jgi:RecB family exonuclease
MEPIPEYVLKNGPWSISKAGVIAKCSLQYDYKYGPNKIPEPAKEGSPESRIGTTVHKALEFSLDDIQTKKAFELAVDQNQLTTDEVDKVMCYYEQVERFTARIAAFRAKHGVVPQNVFIERKISVTPEFKSTTFFDKTALFRGVVDFMVITPRGDAIIIDHKSGKQKEMKYYADQCKAYCILALALFPELKGVQTAINFVQTDQLEWNPRVTAETIRTEYHPWLVKYLADSCVDLLEPPKPKEGWWCDWCPYATLCPLKSAKK